MTPTMGIRRLLLKLKTQISIGPAITCPTIYRKNIVSVHTMD